MRLSVELLLANNKINKDKNRIVMHVLKLLIKKESGEVFRELYEDNISSPKDLNFSMYLGRDAKFLQNEIEIPSQKIVVNFSTSDSVIGISIYNAFTKHRGLEVPIEGNVILINKVNIVRTQPITSEKVTFVTKSPIVVRSHDGNNKNTHYHDLSEESGQQLFLTNLKYQIQNKFPNISQRDLDDIKIRVIWNKTVRAKHYGIVILGNLCEFEIQGKAYILDEIYLNGVCARRSQGFGYVELVG